MKKIGILGGMSWESTALYYSLINGFVREALGGLNSAKMLVSSVNFAEVAAMQKAGEWNEAADLLRKEAQGLERAGAEGILIATNTMHKVLPLIEDGVTIPFIHIADATGAAIKAAGHTKVGFMGTKFAMEESFYTDILEQRYNLEMVIPDLKQRDVIHRVIFEELCQGKILESSRQHYLDIIDQMAEGGAQCVIEGCTEITLLVKQEHTNMPLFDTTRLHARAAADFILETS
ncbi:aspartate racemase [Marinomonas piezotolerans]|uniref:Aspartate racemase n=1 Tax=Marinomonas piezotolerans TaxID=2213058 RepID=A0A370U9V3_9GAMM|nr:aspartate/glutamate racemase family protein [Marinomonas piezotolerans]RDL44567.1 aspartate racemase [Marinomonas piezotolerans]